MTHRNATSPASATAALAASPGERPLDRLRRHASWHLLAPVCVFAAMLLAVSILNPSYLGPFGISIVTATAAPILLVALGQAMILNIGSIDLTNAAIGLLSSILIALTLSSLGVGSLLLVLFLVTVIGAVNGAVVAYAQVPSFALTLGTLGILQTAVLVISGANTIYVDENRELVTFFYEVQWLNVPLTFWLGVGVALFYWLLLRLTRVGQNMTAIGKNEIGAILSAVPNRRVKILAFAISGFTGGLAGIAILAQAGSASASGLGSALLLPGIAAALVGGTSISGGQTNPINVVFGALTVAFVPVAIQALRFSAEAQSLVYGIFIIVVVALTTARERGLIIR
ncbi:ABC transporter permease [Aureimonas psammosilenae]|uniref:ABC transporter permease n=1 Tax=Aureimonas psammosilenae TaxID=2495496 RepID=UPI0012612C61|nr:ABC transporter permease [Aureimonas psammosilenae]